MRILGIDYGSKRIGLAIGDTETRLAAPLRTLPNDKTFWGALGALLKDEDAQEIVIGIPRSLRDQKGIGETAAVVEQFIAELDRRTGFPIHREDERFSSDLADQFAETTKANRDAVAASIILQAYFDRTPAPRR